MCAKLSNAWHVKTGKGWHITGCTLRIKDTSLLQTIQHGPAVSIIQRFHCIRPTVLRNPSPLATRQGPCTFKYQLISFLVVCILTEAVFFLWQLGFFIKYTTHFSFGMCILECMENVQIIFQNFLTICKHKPDFFFVKRFQRQFLDNACIALLYVFVSQCLDESSNLKAGCKKDVVHDAIYMSCIHNRSHDFFHLRPVMVRHCLLSTSRTSSTLCTCPAQMEVGGAMVKGLFSRWCLDLSVVEYSQSSAACLSVI